ncbi:hypothetical protein ACWEO5_37170, partial [Kitasatospora sp. NPDC004272]
MRTRPWGLRPGSRPSRAYLAAVLAWAVAAAVVLLPLGGPGVQPARAAAGQTFEGPARWDPATWTEGDKGTITVSQVSGLGNQVVHVSWTGFTPTVDIYGSPVNAVTKVGTGVDGSADNRALYPVRIYQCRGEKPFVTDCYGSSLYGGDPAAGFLQPSRPDNLNVPEFPSNMVIAATRPDGTGEADIELWTAQQSQTLGCDPTHKCSLVVEPNYGGDPLGAYSFPDSQINCDDHSADADNEFNTATDFTLMRNMFRVDEKQYWSGEACAWARHVTIPLDFGPTTDACKAGDNAFSAIGLEMADRAMAQWRTGACLASDPMQVQYSVGNGEPQARSAFLRRSGADVALTSVPDRNAPTRPYVYAPLTNGAISVVHVVDDAVTGQQVRRLRLNQRLLAKMLTQTYRYYQDDTETVRGNPMCLFDDQEFRALNADTAPGMHWPSCTNTANTAPVVVGGTTDLVQRLTEWIAADPDADQFLHGAADPWGTHVNAKFLPPTYSGYPVDTFQTLDYTGQNNHKQYEWNPVLGGLGQVLRMTLQNQLSCQLPYVDASGQHKRCFSMVNGQRALFAVMDSGDAQAMSLPEAELPNPAGQFTTPTIASMQAAAKDMPFDETTGTQQLPYGDDDSAYAKDPKAYPLTMVQYAMLPTEGLGQAKAAAVSGFVRTVTDPGRGQVYGRAPGQLAVGYAALTKAQAAQAKAAADHVAAQDGGTPGKPADTGTEGGDGGGSGSTGSATGGSNGGGTGGSSGGISGGAGSVGGTDDATTGGTPGTSGTGAVQAGAAASGKPGGSASPG